MQYSKLDKPASGRPLRLLEILVFLGVIFILAPIAWMYIEMHVHDAAVHAKSKPNLRSRTSYLKKIVDNEVNEANNTVEVGEDDLVNEVLQDNPAEDRGVRDEWVEGVGLHRKEDIFSKKDGSINIPNKKKNQKENQYHEERRKQKKQKLKKQE